MSLLESGGQHLASAIDKAHLVVHDHTWTACRLGSCEVPCIVTDAARARETEREIPLRLDQHSLPGSSAITAIAPTMRAYIDSVNFAARSTNLTGHSFMDLGESFDRYF